MLKKELLVSDFVRKHLFSLVAILLVGFINNCVSFLLPVSIGEFFAIHFLTGSSRGKLLRLLFIAGGLCAGTDRGNDAGS